VPLPAHAPADKLAGGFMTPWLDWHGCVANQVSHRFSWHIGRPAVCLHHYCSKK